MRSVSGLVLDDNTLFAAFDALLAANRTRLLAEFKSRMFTPPADSAQCRKDGLPFQVCGGGVRVNWDEVNSLLKRKLLFVHFSFDSQELPYPPAVISCRGSYEEGKQSDCDMPPVGRYQHAYELRALRPRLKQIPTTFGLSLERNRVTSLPSPNCSLHQITNALCILERCFLPERWCTMIIFTLKPQTPATRHHRSRKKKMARRRSRAEAIGDWIPHDGSPIEKQSIHQQPIYVPLKTVEERDAFWSEVLKHYGRGKSTSLK